MNLHHLELFYYVAKYEGVTAATRRMPKPVQQPALSSQMQAFEEELGVSLFQRRPFALTPQGERLYDLIYPFFSRLAHLEHELRCPEEEELRLASGLTLMSKHLPPLFDRLRQGAKNFRFTLLNSNTEEFENLLLKRQADIALGVLPEAAHPKLKREPWLRLRSVILVPQDCAIESLDELLRRHFTVEEALISLPASELITRLFERELERRGVFWPRRIEVPSSELVLEYVARGYGYGLALSGPNQQWPEGLRALCLGEGMESDFGVLIHPKMPPIASAFLDLVRAQVEPLRHQQTHSD